MQRDTEERQLRALEAMEALHCLFESIAPDCDMPMRHVAALFGLAHDAVCEAIPKPRDLIGVNDRL